MLKTAKNHKNFQNIPILSAANWQSCSTATDRFKSPNVTSMACRHSLPPNFLSSFTKGGPEGLIYAFKDPFTVLLSWILSDWIHNTLLLSMNCSLVQYSCVLVVLLCGLKGSFHWSRSINTGCVNWNIRILIIIV